MSDWEPGKFHKDPQVNATLNVARELSRLSEAVGSLFYAFKYAKDGSGIPTPGMTVAEAIEVAGRAIADAIPRPRDDD